MSMVEVPHLKFFIFYRGGGNAGQTITFHNAITYEYLYYQPTGTSDRDRERFHQRLAYKTPRQVHSNAVKKEAAAYGHKQAMSATLKTERSGLDKPEPLSGAVADYVIFPAISFIVSVISITCIPSGTLKTKSSGDRPRSVLTFLNSTYITAAFFWA